MVVGEDAVGLAPFAIRPLHADNRAFIDAQTDMGKSRLP